MNTTKNNQTKISKISSKIIFEHILLLTINTLSDPSKQLAKRLDEIGFSVPMGSLYPFLSELHRNGYLEHGYEEMNTGTPRKTYAITDKGQRRLADLDQKWSELNQIIHRARMKN